MSENTSRARQFKNQGRGTEDGRRKRADASLELRKMKKDDQLMKRRNVADVDIEEPTSPLGERSSNVVKSPVHLATIPQVIAAIIGTDSVKRMHGVQSARKILSREKNPPIDDLIRAGIVPHLVRFLSDSDSGLQFEAAWALTNIASGSAEQTMCVVKAGAVPKFVALLKSSEENVAEQAVWALGNIAGDGPHLRDEVIQAGAVDPLISLVKADAKVPFLRNIAWTLSNLCRNKNPPPPLESCCRCLPVFARLLCHNDSEVLSDTCWALSYITDGTNEKIQCVLEAGVLPRLVQLLYHEESSVVTSALRTVGNIVTGNDVQTQAVIEATGAIQALPLLLAHNKPSVRKEAAWTISNITAGNQAQIQAIIDGNIIPGVIELMAKGDFKAQKEAVWAITNLTSGGTLEQTVYVVDQGCLPPLISLMTAKDAKAVLVVLDAINNILVAAEKYGAQAQRRLCEVFEELGGVDKLEALQEHDNTEIYQYAQRLVVTYFSEEVESDEDLAPTQQDGQFTFSQAAPSSNGTGDSAPPTNFEF